jgi:uncharacterized membrane protein YedE/YeeE
VAWLAVTGLAVVACAGHYDRGMTIDWPSFTPFAALAGGVLIGAASALYLLISGRIAGITGILAGPLQALALRRPLAPLRPQLLFVVGLLAAPLAWRLFAPLPEATLAAGPGVLVAAGLLVGVGTRLANGCTSGHGVCGLARLSLRSLANVLVFMVAGFATVYVVRHVLGG